MWQSSFRLLINCELISKRGPSQRSACFNIYGNKGVSQTHPTPQRGTVCVCVSDSVIHLCMLLCTHLIAVNTRDVAGKLLKCPFIIFYVACSRRPSSPLPSRRRSRCRSHGRSSSFTSFRRPILSRQMALTWQHQQQHPCEYPCMSTRCAVRS